MDIVREKEQVNHYHFDRRNIKWEKEKGRPKTEVKVEFHLNESKEETQTHLLVTVRFMIVLQEYVVSGLMMQKNQIRDRLVHHTNEFSDEEKHEIAEPLLNMLQRLTYDVTEIVFDKPGVNLEL